ncbi:MAG: phosphopantetheine-binding protein [Bacteroidota bacterium]
MPDTDLTELKREIKVLIIEATQIPEITPEDIIDDAPLFGEGLGLDSIDSLEIVLALQRKYDVEINDQNLALFILQSVNTIADFIQKEKTKRA